jgi:hypothetical protein
LGKETYLAWWSQRIIDALRARSGNSLNITIDDLIRETGISEEDILWTLEEAGLLKIVEGQAVLCLEESLLAEVYRAGGRPGKPVLRECLHWVPFRIKWEGYPVNY